LQFKDAICISPSPLELVGICAISVAAGGHWLFEAQINTIGDLNKNINFVGKGVDKYNPVLPKSMPRGYGGVAIIWRFYRMMV
jgi:hypothetical protein